MSYSLSNHWAMVAGGAPPVAQQNLIGLELAQNSTNHTTQSPLKWFQAEYLSESNVTPSVADQLRAAAANGSAPSWTYYDVSLPAGRAGYNESIHNGETWDYWNPLAAKNETYLDPTMNAHFVNRTNILGDAANGTLPNLAWVLPLFAETDHPISDISNGMQWVTSVVDAIAHSPEWNTTAIFLSWDEYGGYYDHVPPPQIDSAGLGFRVPLLIISPYAREGYIDPEFGYFESVLHLMEWRFGLPPITSRVAAAPLPLHAFDLTQVPRLPFTLPAGPIGTVSYPLPFEPAAAPPTPANLSENTNGSALELHWTVPPGGGSIDRYRLSYGTSPCALTSTTTADGAATGVSWAGLAAGGPYVLQLRSVGPSSTSANATDLSGLPSPPGGCGSLGGGTGSGTERGNP